MKQYINVELKEKMQFIKHKSGLKVYLFPKKGFTKYYAIYGTEYGSLNRTFLIPGDSDMTTVPDGIAHYLEHKLFEEENGGNAFDRFAETGASSNAFTSFDLTAYLFSCTEKFYENLEILVGFVNSPYFTDENVDKERGIIGQEIRMYDDEPEWRVFFNTLTAMFHNNPVKIDIAGTVESIAEITPEMLYKCYNTFYNPSNMTLVLVGDISMDKVMDILDRYIRKTNNIGKIERNFPKEPIARVQEYVEQNLTVSQPMFRVGFKDNSPRQKGNYLLKKEITTEIILESVFGKSGDLYLDLYEQGLIDSSFDYETDLAYEYGFTLIGGESSNPEKVYSIIKDKIDFYRKNGIPTKAIERAKKVLISHNIKLFNSVQSMGNVFIRQLINEQNPLEYKQNVEIITYEDIYNRLIEHFDTSNCVLSVVKPNVF